MIWYCQLAHHHITMPCAAVLSSRKYESMSSAGIISTYHSVQWKFCRYLNMVLRGTAKRWWDRSCIFIVIEPKPFQMYISSKGLFCLCYSEITKWILIVVVGWICQWILSFKVNRIYLNAFNLHWIHWMAKLILVRNIEKQLRIMPYRLSLC